MALQNWLERHISHLADVDMDKGVQSSSRVYDRSRHCTCKTSLLKDGMPAPPGADGKGSSDSGAWRLLEAATAEQITKASVA